MSTHFFNYRINKEELWPTVESIRSFYQQHSVLGIFLQALLKQIEDDRDSEQWQQLLEKLASFEQDNRERLGEEEVELQLFDDGECFIIRPLERGHLFMNSYQKQGWPLQPIFYNDSTDLSEQEIALQPVVERVEQQIKAGEYFLVPIISLSDISTFAIERMLRQTHDSREEKSDEQ